MTPWLVLRPEPGATATAQAIRAMGREPVVAPLFTVRPVDFAAPDVAQHDAILLTSANAARALEGLVGELARLPVYAVGMATAEAADAAGLTVLAIGDADAAALVARAAADRCRRLLHLAGREHRAVAHPGVTIDRRIVYASEAVEALPESIRAALTPFPAGERQGVGARVRAPKDSKALPGLASLATHPPPPPLQGGEPDALALLHSPRAATLFTQLLAAAGIDRATLAIAALSPAVAEAAGAGWAAIAVADRPTDAALLAAAAGLCERRGRGGPG